MTEGSPTFEIHGRLGTGGMAQVYLAKTRGPDGTEWVALKRIRPEVSDNAEYHAQFEREARICALLRHENVVALRAFGRDRKGPYLALEYVKGPSAGKLVKAFRERGEHLPIEVALSIGRDAARGLAYAHQLDTGLADRGVIHRDISPENVLISRGGVAKLADFGVAKLLGATSFTRTGTVKGKFGYMAPELFEGQEAGIPTDCFAFGALNYFLLCGVPPFQGRTEAEIMRAILSATAPRLSSLRSEIPPDIESWIMQSLSRAGAERPPISAWMDATEAALAASEDYGRPAVARCLSSALPDDTAFPAAAPDAPETLVARKRSRAPRIAWAIVPGLLLLAGAAVWWGRGARSREVPAAPIAAALPAPVAAPVPAPPAPVAPPPPAVVAEPAPTKPPPSRTKPPTASRRPTAGAYTGSNGTVWVKVHPWARVFFDGQLRGVTPMKPFPVPPGPHQLILVNEELGTRQTRTVDVQAGKLTELKVSLDATRTDY